MKLTIIHQFKNQILFQELLEEFKSINLKLESIMSIQDDILAEIAAIKADVAAGATAAQEISKQIAALQAQIGSGVDGTAIKTALDDLKTGADALAQNLGNIANPPAAPTAPAQ